VELTLDALIRDVQAGAEDPLAQLERASASAQELGELGDALLSHFVDRARRSGHTWADIGGHLGVTRQAAQKRFVDLVGEGVTLDRFTMRARQLLDRAQEIAVGMNHNYVGTEHQLLAMFDDEDALAAKVLAALGVDRKAVARLVSKRVEKGPVPVASPVPLTPRARTVVAQALAVALELGHNYIGTEHLLLGLFRGQDGLAKEILEELGADRDRAKTLVVEMLVGYTANKKAK
jgi:hypothetical protein